MLAPGMSNFEPVSLLRLYKIAHSDRRLSPARTDARPHVTEIIGASPTTPPARQPAPALRRFGPMGATAAAALRGLTLAPAVAQLALSSFFQVHRMRRARVRRPRVSLTHGSPSFGSTLNIGNALRAAAVRNPWPQTDDHGHDANPVSAASNFKINFLPAVRRRTPYLPINPAMKRMVAMSSTTAISIGIVCSSAVLAVSRSTMRCAGAT